MIEIVEADLDNAEHQQAILQLLDAYAQEPIVSGKPLAERVRSELIGGLKNHPTTVVLLAYLDHRAVGIAVCFVGFSTFAARPLLNIHDLAVLAEYRGQGIGRELLAATESKALELHCCKLTLEVDGNNHAARRVYESFGFDSTQHVRDNGQALFLNKQLKA